jgi:hypothetical protein
MIISEVLWLKALCHEIFGFRFFHETSSPRPLKKHRGHYDFFENSQICRFAASVEHLEPRISL